MRLLNVETKRLKEFSSANRPKFAILSHRWLPDQDEVHYEDIEKEDRTEVEQKKGWQKILKTCEKAREFNIEWVWIDTCCINKSSSTELAEALNSMFMWYREADRCFAFLRDVKAGEDVEAKDSSFRKSEWFERGWTLQELIAPKDVIFYSEAWNQIGNRATLQETITQITNIEKDVLIDSKVKLSKVSLARRMSWAANRKTTVVEDVAYSLVGIFGVTLTPIYGEGENAFRRLQIEIIKTSNDHSLFAWGYAGGHTYDGTMFAPHPDCFQHSSDIVKVDFQEFKKEFTLSESITDHTVTNEGLRIRLPVVTDDTFRAITEQIARPYKFAKEISGMKRTIKRMRGSVPFSDLAQSLAKRHTIRAYLACRFTTGDKEFVSIPLLAKTSGRYTRHMIEVGVHDLIYNTTQAGITKVLFYTIQSDTLYITEADEPWTLPPVVDVAHEEEETSEAVPGTPELEAAASKLTIKDPEVETVSIDPVKGTLNFEVKIPESGRKLLKGFKSFKK